MQLETKQKPPVIHKRKMKHQVFYLHSAIKAQKQQCKNSLLSLVCISGICYACSRTMLMCNHFSRLYLKNMLPTYDGKQ